MGRLYLNESKWREIGFGESDIATIRKLMEFVEAQEAIEANGGQIDAAEADIVTLTAAVNALDSRIDAYDALAPFVQQDQAAAPSYTPYAGQTVSAGYVQAEAQATDNAVVALATAFDTLLTRLDTTNVLT